MTLNDKYILKKDKISNLNQDTISSLVCDQSNTSQATDSDSDYGPDPESIEYKLKKIQSNVTLKKTNKGCNIKGCDGSGNIKNVDNIIKFKKHYKEKYCPLKYKLKTYSLKTRLKIKCKHFYKSNR